MFCNRNCCDPMRQNMYGYGMPMGQPMMNAQPMMEGQVVEPTITKCVEQEFYHEVPHVCPIHTHTVNKHIYKHTYTPQYSCSEECQVANLDCGKCSNFI
ncbi:MAG: CotD family spore coat protein [Bacilli bacterium]|nr:CotD family spore coat protein [Bacilli bacterium]